MPPWSRRLNPAYLFLAPSALVFVIFTLWPIIAAFWMSLHEWPLLGSSRRLVGLANYAQLLGDDRFWNALRNTVTYTAGVVPLQVGLAVLLAVALNARIRGRAFLRAAYFVPAISSLAIMAIVWSFLFDPDVGAVSAWLAQLGLPRVAWLREPGTAMIAVIAVGVWKTLGFNMVILLAGLQGISRELYEAAAIDGAGRWSQFLHVTIPGLRQTLLFVTVISFIASMQVFDQVYVMTRGGPLFATETLVTYIFHEGFEVFQLGYASALSGILFAIIVGACFIQLRMFRFGEVD